MKVLVLKLVLFILSLPEFLLNRFIRLDISKKIYFKKNDIISPRKDYSDIAIILQGPLHNFRNFTYQTCLLYKKNYPGVKIIVSTWVDENINTINLLKSENIIVKQTYI
jgi:hypothetical protein